MATRGKTKQDWTKAVPVLDMRAAMNFWRSVDIQAPGECWPWTAGKFTDGYGAFSVNFDDGKARVRHASRVSWAFANLRWPGSDEVIRHTCDDKPGTGYRACCNPAHLVVGTPAQNSGDMVAKNRQSQGNEHYSRTEPERLARGSRVGTAKLNEQKVGEILDAYRAWPRSTKTGKPKRGVLARLSEQHGVTRQMVWQIVHDKWWVHVN